MCGKLIGNKLMKKQTVFVYIADINVKEKYWLLAWTDKKLAQAFLLNKLSWSRNLFFKTNKEKSDQKKKNSAQVPATVLQITQARKSWKCIRFTKKNIKPIIYCYSLKTNSILML